MNTFFHEQKQCPVEEASLQDILQRKKKYKNSKQRLECCQQIRITASHLESSSIVNDVMSYRVIDELM